MLLLDSTVRLVVSSVGLKGGWKTLVRWFRGLNSMSREERLTAQLLLLRLIPWRMTLSVPANMLSWVGLLAMLMTEGLKNLMQCRTVLLSLCLGLIEMKITEILLVVLCVVSCLCMLRTCVRALG